MSSDVLVRRAIQYGFSFLDTPRLLDTSSDPLTQNYGSIVVLYLFISECKRSLLPSPSQLSRSQFLLLLRSVLATYRSKTAPLSPAFFSKFLAIMDLFSTYNSKFIMTWNPSGNSHPSGLCSFPRPPISFWPHPTRNLAYLGLHSRRLAQFVIMRDDCRMSYLTVEPAFISEHGLLIYNIPSLCSARIRYPPLQGRLFALAY